MASTSETLALEEWFKQHSGCLHPAIRILHDDTLGVHCHATDAIQSQTTISSAPHSITLSYLNALVDEQFPVFNQRKSKFKVEAIGFFYLMAQWIHRDQSFWKPYLDTLSAPDDEFTQPLFFEDLDDIAWLEHTDVWHTVTARKAVYEQYYAHGVSILQEAGINVQQYTWHLFKWAAAMFSSRSFTSRTLQPQEGKHWTTYRCSSDERREEVILDMSGTPEDDLIFPVLFPGIDAANHNHQTTVEWRHDAGRFSVVAHDSIKADTEVFINYGPKGNGELLIGYGFCIPDNPYDTVALTLKPPPEELQSALKTVHPEYFTMTGEWNADNATFRIPRPPPHLSIPTAIFEHLPDPLIQVLVYIIQNEHHAPFTPMTLPLDHRHAELTRIHPHIARMIAQYLMQKTTQLQSTTLPSEPKNDKQRQASIYRAGQLSILQSLIAALKTFTRSLIWTPLVLSVNADKAPQMHLPTRPFLIRLEHLTQYLLARNELDAAFLKGIQASANSQDLEQLRLAGWEEDVWVLLLCYIRLRPERYDSRVLGVLPVMEDGDEDVEEGQDRAEELLDVVQTAALACPGSAWGDERWSAAYIARVGGDVLRNDSFMVMAVDDDGVERPQLFVYLHGDDG